MKTCYKCGSSVNLVEVVKEGVTLKCFKCSKCGEELFTSSELIKFDKGRGDTK